MNKYLLGFVILLVFGEIITYFIQKDLQKGSISIVRQTGSSLQCQFGGGTYKVFSNSCGDSCGGESLRTCAMVLERSCDCGEGACWNGKKCVVEIQK